MKRLAWYTAVVVATLAGLLLLWQFREAVLLFLLSLGVAAAARPLVDRVSVGRIPRTAGLLAVYLSFLAIVIGLIVFFGGELLAELGHLSNRFVNFYNQAWTTWPNGPPIQQTIINSLPAPQQLFQAIAGNQGTALAQTFLGVTISSFTILSQVAAILVLSIYWSIDQAHFERLWLSLLPVDSRKQAREIWRTIEAGVGAYIRSEVVQSLLAIVMMGIGFWLMHVQYPILLATFGGLTWLIPWVGGLMGLLPVVWVGLLSGPSLALAAGILYVAILIFLEFFVEPRMYSRRKYSPLLTVLFVLALADVLGILGIILAPPLSAAVQILFRRMTIEKAQAPEVVTPGDIGNLKRRLARVRYLARQKDIDNTPQAMTMVSRINELLDEANKTIVE